MSRFDMITGFLVIEISIIKTRRSGDRGIYIMGIRMQIKWHLNVEKTPISYNRILIFTFGISLWQYTANLKGIQLIYFSLSIWQGCQERFDPFTGARPPWSAMRSDDYGYSRMTVYNGTHLYLEQVSDDVVRNSYQSLGKSFQNH